jgi:hypothetical protein
MSEWWSYRPKDFLLFSERTYYRLIELHNEAVWPIHIVAGALGLIILGGLLRPGAAPDRLITAILAAGWLWTAWSYLFQRYATINWAALYFAAAFVIQAVLLVGWVAAGNGVVLTRSRRARLAASALFAFALIVQPLFAPLAGRPLRQAEMFGVMPDPTVMGTLAVLALSTHRSRWVLMVVPVLWSLVSGLTQWAMGAPEAWIMPAAATLSILLAIRTPSEKRI